MADCKESKEEKARPPFLLKVDSPMDTSDDSTGNSSNEETPAELKEDASGKLEMAEEAQDENNHENSLRKRRMPVLEEIEEIDDGPVTSQNSEDHFDSQLTDLKKRRVGFGKESCVSFKSYAKEYSNSSAKARSIILRPSQLGSITNSTTAPAKSVLRPAKFRNPFGFRAAEESATGEKATSENNKSEESKPKVEGSSSEDESPKFLPLATSTKDSEVNKDVSNSGSSSVEATTSTPVFVFGQNLKERVAGGAEGEDSEKAEEKTDKVQQEEPATENGSAELLFSTAASACRTTARPGLTLSQAAQELEEANRANKRMYSEVTPLTGEEGETNVLQVNCKLFAFDKATSGWQERGRGTLRLNDRDEESRLVIRTTGTQRVILNTKIWPAMTAERAGPKSLRLTAMDVNGDIRIFIVQAGPMETEQLHNLLLPRIKKAQERQP